MRPPVHHANTCVRVFRGGSLRACVRAWVSEDRATNRRRAVLETGCALRRFSTSGGRQLRCRVRARARHLCCSIDLPVQQPRSGSSGQASKERDRARVSRAVVRLPRQPTCTRTQLARAHPQSTRTRLTWVPWPPCEQRWAVCGVSRQNRDGQHACAELACRPHGAGPNRAPTPWAGTGA